MKFCVFVKDESDSPNKYSDNDIPMVEFLIENIYVEYGGRVYQQTVGIPMGTNCAPLVADMFLYSYEADFENIYKRVVQETIKYP